MPTRRKVSVAPASPVKANSEQPWPDVRDRLHCPGWRFVLCRTRVDEEGPHDRGEIPVAGRRTIDCLKPRRTPGVEVKTDGATAGCGHYVEQAQDLERARAAVIAAGASVTEVDAQKDAAGVSAADPLTYRVPQPECDPRIGRTPPLTPQAHGNVPRTARYSNLGAPSPVPRMPVDRDLRRRSHASGSEQQYTGRPQGDFSADELYAIITLAVHHDRAVYGPDHAPPAGNGERLHMLQGGADPMREWLNGLPHHECDGRPPREVVAAYNRVHGEPLTVRQLGGAVSNNPNWTKHRPANEHIKDRPVVLGLRRNVSGYSRAVEARHVCEDMPDASDAGIPSACVEYGTKEAARGE